MCKPRGGYERRCFPFRQTGILITTDDTDLERTAKDSKRIFVALRACLIDLSMLRGDRVVVSICLRDHE
jgi:hypothetical protein